MGEHGVYLVTGATGKVGRHAVALLRESGARVRALTRDPGSARLPYGVEVVRGDLADPGSLDAALDGVTAVFLIWPTLSADHAAPATIGAIAKHARRVVYLSANGVPDDPGEQVGGILGSHAYLERLVRGSGVEWTLLRPTGFAGNTLGWAESIRHDGVVRAPFANMARSLIHERDIAEVAVRVLVEDGHAGATYVLTGPEAISQAEQVRVIGEAIGRPALFEEISPETAREELLAVWGDAETVDGMLGPWAEMAKRPEIVTDTVPRLLGRPARTFAQWAADHADAFRPPSAREVAEEYVSLCREERFGDPAMRGMFAPDVVRVETVGGKLVESRGDEIWANSADFTDTVDVRGVSVGGPYVGEDDRFAIRFSMDVVDRATGRPGTITKVCLYTVRDGRIVREEVCHLTPQQ